jgi:ABC-type cobalamin transport system permease subunit
LLVV